MWRFKDWLKKRSKKLLQKSPLGVRQLVIAPVLQKHTKEGSSELWKGEQRCGNACGVSSLSFTPLKYAQELSGPFEVTQGWKRERYIFSLALHRSCVGGKLSSEWEGSFGPHRKGLMSTLLPTPKTSNPPRRDVTQGRDRK